MPGAGEYIVKLPPVEQVDTVVKDFEFLCIFNRRACDFLVNGAVHKIDWKEISNDNDN